MNTFQETHICYYDGCNEMLIKEQFNIREEDV